MTAGDGEVAVPGKFPAVMPSLCSKDGTDGLGAVLSVLEKSRTGHRPRPSDGTVDITAVHMVGVWGAWLVCSTVAREAIPEDRIVVFCPPIITPE